MSIFGGGRGALDSVQLEEPIDAPRDVPYTPKVSTPVPFTPFDGTGSQPFHSLQFAPNPNREAYSQHFKNWYETYANERTGRVKFNNLDDYDKWFQSIPGGGAQIGDQMQEVYLKGMPDYVKAEYDTAQKQRMIDTATKLNNDRIAQLNAQNPDSDKKWMVNPVSGDVYEADRSFQERFDSRRARVQKIYDSMSPEDKSKHELSYDQDGLPIVRRMTSEFSMGMDGGGGAGAAGEGAGVNATIDASKRLAKSIIVEDLPPVSSGEITGGKKSGVPADGITQSTGDRQRVTLSGRALDLLLQKRPDQKKNVVNGVLTITLPKDRATIMTQELTKLLRESLHLNDTQRQPQSLEAAGVAYFPYR